MNTTNSRYDAQRDATDLVAPLQKWAYFGFLRGFSGIRKEILPEGEMVLPSKAFVEVALADLDTIPHAGHEYEERRRYVMEVEEILRKRQNELVEDHYKNSVFGHVTDFALAFVFVVLMTLLLVEVGPYSPLTLSLFALMGVKIMFLQVSVRRAIRIASAAFKVSHADVKLPWKGDVSVEPDLGSVQAG